MLTCLKLKKYFGGVKAVDGCDLEVKEKTITALIGPNGSGKTTLFNLVSGILKTDGGKIVLDPEAEQARYGAGGYDITNMSPEKISNLGVSRLFQQSRLFSNLTVKDNLLLAFDNEDTKFWDNLLGRNKTTKEKEEKVEQMLKLVDLEGFSAQGGSASGGKNKLARDLSFGQKRLVELLRTILNPHKLLMLDEPVGGVTPKLRKKISEILLKLKQDGETIFLIEHDMNFAFGVADNVIVMDQGKVIAEGKPEQIKNNPRVLEAYLGE